VYHKIAKSYNKLHREEQLKKLAIIRQHIKIIPPLLDVGCGTGISTNYFGIEAVGADNCKEMLAEGKKQYKNLQFAHAEHLPFPDESFSTIISVTAFHNFKNMEKALQEIKRVSRSNNIAISFLKKSKKLPAFRKLLKKYYAFKEVNEDKDIIFIINEKKI